MENPLHIITGVSRSAVVPQVFSKLSDKPGIRVELFDSCWLLEFLGKFLRAIIEFSWNGISGHDEDV